MLLLVVILFIRNSNMGKLTSIVTVVGSSDVRIKNRIWNTLLNLEALPKVRVTRDDSSNNVIYITHPQEFVAEYKLVYCPNKKHYRVYIYVGGHLEGKVNAGYCICTIGSGLAATGFCSLYAFLHKHRANNKSVA